MPRRSTINFDLWNENFDAWLVDNLNAMTESQRLRIPDKLFKKIHKKGKLQIQDLNIMEKAYLFTTAFNGRWQMIAIGEDGKGITKETFQVLSKSESKNYRLLQDHKASFYFTFGDTELMRDLGYISHVLNSDIFNLIKNYRLKGAYKNKRHDEVIRSYEEMLAFLNKYEGSKKILAQKFRLSVPQWYALLFFAQGERDALDFYADSYKYASSGGKQYLRLALYQITKMGLVENRKSSKSRYWITAKGQEFVNEIMASVFFNY